MYELSKDVLDFYDAVPVAHGKCPKCDNICEAKMIKVTRPSDKKTLPWVLFFKDVFILPIITCCGNLIYPSYIKLKPRDVNKVIDKSFFDKEKSHEIGLIKTPVITEEFLNYPIIRNYYEQLEIMKQLKQQDKLFENRKQIFIDNCYSYFSLHYEEVIKEIDGTETLDVFDALITTPYGIHLKDLKSPKANNKDKKYLNWVKKQIRNVFEQGNEDSRQMIFQLIINYFIEWELVQGVYYLHWNIRKYQKMIGKTLLTYMVLQFPLTNYFAYLRENAIYRLVQAAGSDRKRQEQILVFQKKLDKANANIVRLQETNDRQRDVIATLEEKSKTLQTKNDALILQLQTKDDTPNCDSIQARKINELKGIIDSQRSEIINLREINQAQLNKIASDISITDKSLEQNTANDLDLTLRYDLLHGKTIGIFGDVQIFNDNTELPYSIKSADSAQNIYGINVMNSSDVLVVLTQHISHNDMWALKTYASTAEKPIIFSRHSNLKIILMQITEVLDGIIN